MGNLNCCFVTRPSNAATDDFDPLPADDQNPTADANIQHISDREGWSIYLLNQSMFDQTHTSAYIHHTLVVA